MRHLSKRTVEEALEAKREIDSKLIYELLNMPIGSKHIPIDMCSQYIHCIKTQPMIEDGIIDLSCKDGLSLNQQALLMLSYDLCHKPSKYGDFKSEHITDFITAARYMRDLFKQVECEHIHVAYVDDKMRVIQRLDVCSEGLSYVLLEENGIFLQKPNVGRCGIIVAHNHPNNCCLPSDADKRTTDELEINAPLYGMQLLDSLIVTDDCVYSIMFDMSYKDKK